MQRRQRLHPDYEQSYQNNASRQVVELRRSDREAAFNKKRNFRADFYPSDSALLPAPTPNPQNQNKTPEPPAEANQPDNHEQTHSFIILDNQYTQQIIQFNRFPISLDMFDEFIQLIQSQITLSVIAGAIGIRRLLSDTPPPIQQVIDAGILDLLIDYMQKEDQPQIQMEVTWCIANIAAGTSQQCSLLVEKGVIPLLVSIAQENNQGVVEQAIWALGNIGTDCSQYRNMVIDAGGLDAIVDVILSGDIGPQYTKECCWAMANLCRGSPTPEYSKVKQALRVICSMLATGNIQSLQLFADCCWALTHHCQGLRGRAEDILDFDLLGRMIPLAETTDKMQLLMPCLRVIGHVSTGNHRYTQNIIARGGIELLQKCLFHQKKIVRRETVWILSNLTASTCQHVKAVLLRQKMVQKLLEMFFNDSQEVRKEIAFIFSNMCHGGKSLGLDQLFFESGLMQAYVELLGSQTETIVYEVLEALQPILRLGEKKKEDLGEPNNTFMQNFASYGGSEVLQALQYHKSDRIYDKVQYLLNKFFTITVPEVFIETANQQTQVAPNQGQVTECGQRKLKLNYVEQSQEKEEERKCPQDTN